MSILIYIYLMVGLYCSVFSNAGKVPITYSEDVGRTSYCEACDSEKPERAHHCIDQATHTHRNIHRHTDRYRDIHRLVYSHVLLSTTHQAAVLYVCF